MSLDDEGTINLVTSRRTLEGLMFASMRLMEIASSVLVRSEDCDEKIQIAREIWALAQVSQVMYERIGDLRTSDVKAVPRSREYANFTNYIVSLQNPKSELAALVYLAYPDLISAITEHRSKVPVIADEATLTCLSWALDKLSVLRTAGRPGPYCLLPLEKLLDKAHEHFYAGDVGNWDSGDYTNGALIIAPALHTIPIRPGRDAILYEEEDPQAVRGAGYGAAFHDFAYRIELCAMEVCAALLAHHPEAPWGLRFDLAKQVRDEARHFELFMERVRQLGLSPGDRAIMFEVWDKFAAGRTLAERLIIEQRVGEGAALDSADAISARLKADGETEIALVFDYITADEITHVRNGNKWLHYLVGDDEAIFEVEDQVISRLAELGMPTNYKHPINAEHRTLSGFTSQDLKRISAIRAKEIGE